MTKYTDRIYAEMATEANKNNKMLYIVNGKLEINEPNYYICEKDSNITDGTLNPNFGKTNKQDEITKIQEQLFELDQKRIRAVCEPALKDEEQTWLEFYNFQIFELRKKLANLI